MSNAGRTLVVRACASLVFELEPVPRWFFLWQSGDFLAPIVFNGTGDIEIDFLPGFGVDASECAIICTPRAAQVASAAIKIGATHTSDTRKRYTIVRETAAGGETERANINFDLWVVSL